MEATGLVDEGTIRVWWAWLYLWVYEWEGELFVVGTLLD